MKMVGYFLIGLTLAFMVDGVTSCKKSENNPVEPEPLKPPIETEVIKDLEDDAQKAESAFKSGSTAEVKKVISETASKIYGADLENVKHKFSAFADALKNKKLVGYSELYAEYEITVDGKTYFVAFGKQNENGDWKLVRF
jgi:hypothetical protein